MKRTLLLSLLSACALTASASTADSTAVGAEQPQAAASAKRFMEKFAPSIKFGGYVIGKYSVSDRDGQSSNGGFDLRFVRLYLNGYCFKDIYYRLQAEVNGAPGDDKGPRIVDAFVEWQKFDFLRVKLGQFKRPFGFENPYNPLDVGLGSFSQATMKLSSISDRIGEHKSSGRDVGVQLQGDLFPSRRDGHKWIHYQIGFFNGQGINHTDKDNFKDLIGGLWLSPVKDLCIGGFGWNGKYFNENYKEDANMLKEADRKRWGVGLKYESDWTVRGEYVSSVGGVVTNATAPDRSDAWYATVGIPVIDKLKLYVRWDCYRDGKAWSALKSDYDASVNYYFNKNFIVQANYSRVYDRSASIGRRYNSFDIQVSARF